MSRIDDLMAQHCPDGVGYRPLGHLVRIRNGKDYKALGTGEVPVYGSGGVMTRVDTAAHPGPSVLIPRKGSLGNIFYVDQPFWTVDTIFYTEIDASQVLPKFLYYFLLTLNLAEMNQAGGVPSMTQSVLNGLRIPVPPLEAQQEIVRILDAFTALSRALETELEARRTQYRHYCNDLLSFRSTAIEWVPLGRVGHLFRGRRFTKADVVAAGLPSIHYGEIYTRYGVSAFQAVSQVKPALAPSLRFASTGDLVIAAVGETVEDVGKAVAWLGEEDVAIHDDCYAFRHPLNPKFVAYYFQTDRFHAEKKRHVARAKVKRLSVDGLGQISIPLASPQEQERIVQVLDRFDALVNDVSSGLPAEINARRRQYEVYRDRLLIFPERTV